MFHTVLCGVDGSAGAAPVAEVAAAFARSSGGRLILAHAVPATLPVLPRFSTPGATALAQAPGRQTERARAGLKALAERLDVDADLEVLDGSSSEALLRHARESGADLIVVGARRHGVLDAVLAGSVAHAVLRGFDQPVVIVPSAVQAGADHLQGRVLCALQLPARDHRIARAGAAVAAALGRDLVLAHVIPRLREGESAAGAVPLARPEDAQEEHQAIGALTTVMDGLRDEFTDVGHIAVRVGVGKVSEELLGIASEEQAGLIVVDSRRHGPIQAALEGSVSTHLTQDGDVPVMVVGRGRCRGGPRVVGRRAGRGRPYGRSRVSSSSARRLKTSARVTTPTTRPWSTTGTIRTRWWRNVSAISTSEYSRRTSMRSAFRWSPTGSFWHVLRSSATSSERGTKRADESSSR